MLRGEGGGNCDGPGSAESDDGTFLPPFPSPRRGCFAFSTSSLSSSSGGKSSSSSLGGMARVCTHALAQRGLRVTRQAFPANGWVRRDKRKPILRVTVLRVHDFPYRYAGVHTWGSTHGVGPALRAYLYENHGLFVMYEEM